MIQPKCTICGKDLMSNDGYEGQDENKVLIEPQVKYWAHDPRDTHRDIEVSAHKNCADKVKETYPDFDQPTQDKKDYPIINKAGAVVLKKVADFNKLKIL